MALITYKGIGEGEIFNKWLYSRLIRTNKNVISAELGATGSGKSYRDLRKIELWYKYYFKEKVPVENICFGIPYTMQMLHKGNLRRGEILVIEEAGVNLGSRNWQSKVSKMFNYVLQSFRSENIGVFLNLPYLTMLDSQARHLLHYYAESSGINFEKKTNKCKPFFLQVAQGTGKIYKHYPEVKIGKRSMQIQRFNYSLPSQYLIDAYEKKKEEYVKNLIKGYAEALNGKNREKEYYPSKLDYDCYHLYHKEGISFTEIGKIKNIARQTASSRIKKVEKYKKVNNITEFTKKNREMTVKKI